MLLFCMLTCDAITSWGEQQKRFLPARLASYRAVSAAPSRDSTASDPISVDAGITRIEVAPDTVNAQTDHQRAGQQEVATGKK